MAALDRRRLAGLERHVDQTWHRVFELDSKKAADQGLQLVDQRGIEPLTSPVREVRKGLRRVA